MCCRSRIAAFRRTNSFEIPMWLCFFTEYQLKLPEQSCAEASCIGGNREFIASDMVRVNRLLKARQDVQVVFTSWRSAWSRFILSAAMRNDFSHKWLQESVQSKVNEVHSQSPRLQARIRVIPRSYSLHVVTWYSLQHACHLLLRKPRCSTSHHVQPIYLLHVYKKIV